MKSLFIPLIIIPIVIFSLVSNGYAQPLEFITHNLTGKVFTDSHNQLRGKPHSGRRAFQIELIREMMTLVGYPKKTFSIYPFRRGLLAVQTKENIAFFNAARRPDREGTVKWVGPLQSDVVSFYEATGFPKNISTLDEAKKVNQICVLNGNAHDKFLVRNGFKNIYRAGNYEACFNMLVQGRVDLAVQTDTSFQETLTSSTISPDLISLSAQLYLSKGYLIMSLNIEDRVIEQWQGALDSLKNNGRYEQLYNKYMK